MGGFHAATRLATASSIEAQGRIATSQARNQEAPSRCDTGKATIRTIMHEPLEDRVLFAFDSITIVGGATGSADSFLSDGEILQSEGSGDATVSINAIDTALKNGFNIKLEASQIDFASSIGSVSLSATGAITCVLHLG